MHTHTHAHMNPAPVTTGSYSGLLWFTVLCVVNVLCIQSCKNLMMRASCVHETQFNQIVVISQYCMVVLSHGSAYTVVCNQLSL